jgi:hypothetical protein
MRYQNTVFGNLLKALPRRRSAAIVERHGGDKYVKDFSSWDHLVTLIIGQLGGLSSLREVETVRNAQAIHHFHVGSGPIRRSTLSDANRRRPSAIFAEIYAWWQRLRAAGCRFVTRPKTNVPLRVLSERPVSKDDRQNAAIESDSVVEVASQQRLRLPIELRRIVLRREDDRRLTILSNDLERSAGAIGALYRKRWQIEPLFRWINQHLKIRTFLGRSENAIRVQILAAMITYLLLRLAARDSRSNLLALRFADLVRTRLFEHRSVAHLDKPPSTAQPPSDVQNQLTFAYA